MRVFWLAMAWPLRNLGRSMPSSLAWELMRSVAGVLLEEYGEIPY
jgi:hypothetical protein